MMQVKTRDSSARISKPLPTTVLPHTAVTAGEGFTVYIEPVRLSRRKRRRPPRA
jgi:hypothetical protein